uniref:Uncharacterized protein n=1 Tax=Arundo donax TaxID=35708 RepID=A0A0A9FXW3_ARUDO
MCSITQIYSMNLFQKYQGTQLTKHTCGIWDMTC